MTTAIRPAHAAPSAPRSVAAVAGALVANAVAAAVVDQLMIQLGVFPPWGQITHEPLPYAIAVVYRTVIGVGSGYLAARWAPRAPRRHALWLGVVGTALGLVGLAAALARDFGPVWYPALLVLLAVPSTWLGGALHARVGRNRLVRSAA